MIYITKTVFEAAAVFHNTTTVQSDSCCWVNSPRIVNSLNDVLYNPRTVVFLKKIVFINSYNIKL